MEGAHYALRSIIFRMTLDANYRRTAAGDDALRSVDTAIPVDYRRVPCIIEGDTHGNVIRGRLRRYRDALIDAWLTELEELGFIETVRASAAYDLDFQPLADSADNAASAGDLIEFPDELQQIADEAKGRGRGAPRQGRLPGGGAPAEPRAAGKGAVADRGAPRGGRSRPGGAGRPAAQHGRLPRQARAQPPRNASRARNTQPAADVVLLDAVLPDGDGFQILADIRRGLDLGADGYITKPYSKDVLVDTIRQVLRLA